MKTNKEARKELIARARSKGLEFEENNDNTVFLRKPGSNIGISWSDLTREQRSLLRSYVAACDDGETISKW